MKLRHAVGPLLILTLGGSVVPLFAAQEAATGLDDTTVDEAFVPQATRDKFRANFDEVDTTELDSVTHKPGGLGPVYNAQSCRECHQNPVSGAGSQVTVQRAGHLDRHHRFRNPVVPIDDGKSTIIGRNLINDRAICPRAQERVPESETVRTQRLSLSTLGDGFIEAIADNTLLAIRDQQCKKTGKSKTRPCGQALAVPVIEAPKVTAIGRFGWKDQHASLLSFSADAYLNEVGVTSRLLPNEVTTVCNPTGVPEPNDTPGDDGLADIDHFAGFMRSSKAPSRDETLAATPAVISGRALFERVGCSACHVESITTAPAGTMLFGGKFTVPAALGDKTIHPYSDFLLHDVGTGDGIAISIAEHHGAKAEAIAQIHRDYDQDLGKLDAEFDRLIDRPGFSHKAVHDGSNKIRTPPLWGLRLRTRLMHDGASGRFTEAIERHHGEAQSAHSAYKDLSAADRDKLLQFLRSL